MSHHSFVARRKHVSIAVALALAGFASSTQAFTENASFKPKTLLVFSGPPAEGGSVSGSRPFAPPVYVASENRYVGLTQKGGGIWEGQYVGVKVEGATLFQVATDGTAYVSQPLGKAFGQQVTPLLRDADSGDIYVGGESAVDTETAAVGGTLFVIRGGQAYPLANHGDELPAARFVPRGQMALDANGRLYFGAATGTVVCTNETATRTTNNLLYHFFPASGGLLQPSVNFCDFNEKIERLNDRGRRVITYAHLKGSSPRLTLWSDTDQALYVLAGNSSSETNMDGVPSTDNSGKPVSTLLRIRADALTNRLEVGAADKLEVLHQFGKARDGQLRAGLDYVSALLEVGDYIYGTSFTTTSGDNATALGGALWRVHKKQGSSSFEVVHRFTEAENGTDVDGSNPAGTLVRAADGSIYGTTVADARVLTFSSTGVATAAKGAGTLFRVKAPDSAEPVYEPLSYFDEEVHGARPVGLEAGPIVTQAGGSRYQVLVGATRFGGNEGDTLVSLDDGKGHGTLFTVNVPIVDAVLTRFTTSATVSRPGTRPTLQWSSTGTDSCVASGDWSGEQASAGSYRPPALNELRDYVFTLQCSGYTGQTEARSVTIKVIDGSGTQDDGHGGGGALAGGLLLALGLLARLRAKTR